MLLQPGKTFEDGIKSLDQAISGIDKVRTSIPNVNSVSFSKLMPPVVSAYKRWAESASRQLLMTYQRGPIINRLHAEMYWLIVSSPVTSSSTPAMMDTELGELKNYFLEVASELRESMNNTWQGPWIVLDTNDLLHYYRFDTIPWTTLYGSPVRVAMSTVVIDEIDSKSYESGPKIQKRARGVYRILEGLLNEMETQGLARLGDGTLFEILPDELDRERLPNNDNEIIARALSLKQMVVRGTVTIVTRDIGMRARALAQGLAVSKLPDKYLIREEGLSEEATDEALSSISPASSGQEGK